MPFTRSHVRKAADAYLDRHPHERDSLAGHCEREGAVSCLVSVIEPDDVEFVHLVRLVDSPSARPRIGLAFRTRAWSGAPAVREPDRCVEWRWWNPKDLPDAVAPYTRQAIEGVLAGRLSSQKGWYRR